MIKNIKSNFHIIISVLVAVILIINGIIYQINEIKIYCDKNNPSHYTDGTISKYGIYLIIIGVIIILIDILVIIKNKLK